MRNNKIQIADNFILTEQDEQTTNIFDRIKTTFNHYTIGSREELGHGISLVIFGIAKELTKLHEKLDYRQIIATCNKCGCEVELDPSGEKMYQHKITGKPMCDNVEDFHIDCKEESVVNKSGDL